MQDNINENINQNLNGNTTENDSESIEMYYPDGDAEHMAEDDLSDAVYSPKVKKKKKKKKKKKSKKMTPVKIALLVAAFVLYTALIFFAAYLIFYRPTQPSLDNLPFETEDTSSNKPPLDGDDENDGKEDDGEKQFVPIDGVYNILVVGHDLEAHLADVTMIVNCNEKTGKFTVMQIPRDTLVTVGVATNKINAAFATYYNDAIRTREEDPYKSALAKYESMLESSLCININHAVLMDLEGFRGIVNAIGGVDVYVPADMYYVDPEQNLTIDIKKGMQHLDGNMAEGFVRFRSGWLQADLGRVNAQKIFLTAFFNKVKATVKSADVVTLSKLADEIFKCLHTDLNVADLIYYAKLALKIDLSGINMVSIPGNVAGSYYVINRKSTLALINESFNIYNTEITDSIFDKSYTYCFTDQPYITEVYYAGSDGVFDKVYNAEDIDSDSISIPAYTENKGE